VAGEAARRHGGRDAGEEERLWWHRAGAGAGSSSCRQGVVEIMNLPKGFLARGIRAGIRKKRPDLGLIVAPDGANAAAVFTKNRFLAAPVVLSRNGLKRTGGKVK